MLWVTIELFLTLYCIFDNNDESIHPSNHPTIDQTTTIATVATMSELNKEKAGAFKMKMFQMLAANMSLVTILRLDKPWRDTSSVSFSRTYAMQHRVLTWHRLHTGKKELGIFKALQAQWSHDECCACLVLELVSSLHPYEWCLELAANEIFGVQRNQVDFAIPAEQK